MAVASRGNGRIGPSVVANARRRLHGVTRGRCVSGVVVGSVGTNGLKLLRDSVGDGRFGSDVAGGLKLRRRRDDRLVGEFGARVGGLGGRCGAALGGIGELSNKFRINHVVTARVIRTHGHRRGCGGLLG